MKEGMLLEGAIQKIVKNLWGMPHIRQQKQKLYKMKQNGILLIWTDLKHAVAGLNTCYKPDFHLLQKIVLISLAEFELQQKL